MDMLNNFVFMKNDHKFLIIGFFLSLFLPQKVLSQNLDEYFRDFIKVQTHYVSGNTKKLDKSILELRSKLTSYGDNEYVLWIDLHTNQIINIESMLAFEKRFHALLNSGGSSGLNAQVRTDLTDQIQSKLEEGLITALSTALSSEFVQNSDGILKLIKDDYKSIYSWRLNNALDAYLQNLVLDTYHLCALGNIDEWFIQSEIERITGKDVNEARVLCECGIQNKKLSRLCNYFDKLTDNSLSSAGLIKIAEYLNGLDYKFTGLEQNAMYKSIAKAPLSYQREYIASDFPSLILNEKMKATHDSLALALSFSSGIADLIKYHQEAYMPENKLKIKSIVIDRANEMNISPFNYKLAEVTIKAVGRKLDVKLPASKIDSIQDYINSEVPTVKWFGDPQYASDYSSSRYQLGECEIEIAENDMAAFSPYFGTVRFEDLFEFVSEEECWECPRKYIEPIMISNDSILYFDIRTRYYESGSVSNFFKANLRNGKIYDLNSNLLVLGVHSDQSGFQNFAINSEGYFLSSTSKDTLFIKSNTFLNSDYIYVVDYDSKSRPVLLGKGGQSHALIMKQVGLELELNGEPAYFDSEYFNLYTSGLSTHLWPSYLTYGKDYFSLGDDYEVERATYLEVQNKLLFSSRCNKNPNQILFLYHSSWIDSDEHECNDPGDLKKNLSSSEIITEKELPHYPDFFLSKYRNFLVPFQSINELYRLSEESRYSRSGYRTNNSINSYRLAEYFELMRNCDYRTRIKETYMNSIYEMDGSVQGLINLSWDGQLKQLPCIEVDSSAKMLFDHYSLWSDYRMLAPLATFECSVNLTFAGYDAREESAIIKVDVKLKELDDYYLANTVKGIHVLQNVVSIDLTNSGFTFVYKIDVELNQVENFKKRVSEFEQVQSQIELKIDDSKAIFSWNPVI
jgi:hypothetical protein